MFLIHFKKQFKIKYTIILNNKRVADLERYKNEIKNNQIKFMIYSVGKEYGDLPMAKSLCLDDLYEAYQALVLFNEISNK